MSISEILTKTAEHLIELMAVVTVIALYLRYAAYRACSKIQSHVKGLSRGVEKSLTKIKREGGLEPLTPMDWVGFRKVS